MLAATAATARRALPASLRTPWRTSAHALRRTLSTAAPADEQLKVTTLPNGVRVASDPTPGHFVAAGVYVDAGSRYESAHTRGAAHMTDRLAFKVRLSLVGCRHSRLVTDRDVRRVPQPGQPTR